MFNGILYFRSRFQWWLWADFFVTADYLWPFPKSINLCVSEFSANHIITIVIHFSVGVESFVFIFMHTRSYFSPVELCDFFRFQTLRCGPLVPYNSSVLFMCTDSCFVYLRVYHMNSECKCHFHLLTEFRMPFILRLSPLPFGRCCKALLLWIMQRGFSISGKLLL